MTTGYDVLDGGHRRRRTPTRVLIFRQGAGHVRPTAAANPGLVFDSGWNDWLRLPLRPLQPGGVLHRRWLPIRPEQPERRVDRDRRHGGHADGDAQGHERERQAATYTASVTGMAGFNVAVSPGVAHACAGATRQTFTVHVHAHHGHAERLHRRAADLDATARTTVRIPIVVRPVALAAPAQVSGLVQRDVRLHRRVHRHAARAGPGRCDCRHGRDDPTDSTCSLTSPNAQLISVAVPAGTTYARFSLFDADVNAGSRHRPRVSQRRHAGWLAAAAAPRPKR